MDYISPKEAPGKGEMIRSIATRSEYEVIELFFRRSFFIILGEICNCLHVGHVLEMRMSNASWGVSLIHSYLFFLFLLDLLDWVVGIVLYIIFLEHE